MASLEFSVLLDLSPIKGLFSVPTGIRWLSTEIMGWMGNAKGFGLGMLLALNGTAWAEQKKSCALVIGEATGQQLFEFEQSEIRSRIEEGQKKQQKIVKVTELLEERILLEANVIGFSEGTRFRNLNREEAHSLALMILNTKGSVRILQDDIHRIQAAFRENDFEKIQLLLDISRNNEIPVATLIADLLSVQERYQFSALTVGYHSGRAKLSVDSLLLLDDLEKNGHSQEDIVAAIELSRELFPGEKPEELLDLLAFSESWSVEPVEMLSVMSDLSQFFSFPVKTMGVVAGEVLRKPASAELVMAYSIMARAKLETQNFLEIYEKISKFLDKREPVIVLEYIHVKLFGKRYR